MSSTIDPAKLKVVELRAELSARGLDAKGNKPVLVQRLKEALEKELRQDDSSVDSTAQEENQEEANETTNIVHTDNDVDKKETQSAEVIQETPASIEEKSNIPEKEDNLQPEPIKNVDSKPEPIKKVDSKPEPIKNVDSKPEPIKNVDSKPEPIKNVDSTPEPITNDESKLETITNDGSKSENITQDEQISNSLKSDDVNEQNGEHVSEENVQEESTKDVPMQQISPVPESDISQGDNQDNLINEIDKVLGESTEHVEEKNDTRGEKRKRSPSPMTQNKRSKSPIKEDEPEIDNDKVQLSWYDSDLHLQVDKETFLSAKPYHEDLFGYVWAGVRATHGVKSGKVYFEIKITEELQWEDIIKQPEKGKSEENPKPKIDNVEEVAKTMDDVKELEEEKATETQDGDEKSESHNETGDQNQDSIDKENNSENTENENLEINNADESEKMDVDIDNVEEIVPHLIRIGWSLASSDLQLGECEHSFGYESSGKFVNNKVFTEYAIPFTVGDVVGAYIDISSTNVSLVYTVNGEIQPTAISFPKTDLPIENCAFFPHVLSKNYSFELNLGNREEPWFPNIECLADYLIMDKVEDKIAGPLRPNDRNDCEVVMMCGLPGAGKTHWVQNYLNQNPDKKYTVLGNSFLLNRMTVNGTPIKNNYKKHWNQVLEKLTKSLDKIVEIAALKRRNYILDQNNVYHSGQRRKMRSFEGFKRRAVVVVVSDEEHAKRLSLQENETSDGTILEMKASMAIPRKGEFLDEVVYAELGEEEAKAAVQKYNVQGKDAGYGPSNQNQIKRHDNRNRWQNKRDSRGNNFRDQRHYQNSRYDRNNQQGRHGYWSSRTGSSWNNRNDRRDNRGNRDYRNNRAPAHYQDRGRTDSRKNNFNRRPAYPPNRNQGSAAWQAGNSGNWSGNQNTWSAQNQASWQNWGQNWNQYKQYNQQGYNQQQQPQGYGYSNWNYYGQYAQNWNSQGQPNSSSSSQTSQSGQYNQMTPQQQQQAWAQYTQQYNTQNSQQPVQK